MPARTRETCDTGRFKKPRPTKEAFGGNLEGTGKRSGKEGTPETESNPGGEYEIRTREAVTPTRFPSVRHRPLGEFSNYATLSGVYPLSAT